MRKARPALPHSASSFSSCFLLLPEKLALCKATVTQLLGADRTLSTRRESLRVFAGPIAAEFPVRVPLLALAPLPALVTMTIATTTALVRHRPMLSSLRV